MNKKIVSKYIPQVKAAREEVQADFTTKDKLSGGSGAVNLRSLSQIAANNSTPSNKMEERIQASLAKQGIVSEKDLVAKEVD